VYTSERSTPFTIAGFSRMIEQASVEADIDFKAHPHCGDMLAAMPP
jgi:type 1 fimbriae regulatory protein FimB/type 1 fimbriae regulatory protein FimE